MGGSGPGLALADLLGWRWRGEGGALPQTQCYTILSYMLGRYLCTTLLLILGVPCLCLVLQHTVLVKVLLHRFYLGCLCFTLRALNRTLYKSASVKCFYPIVLLSHLVSTSDLLCVCQLCPSSSFYAEHSDAAPHILRCTKSSSQTHLDVSLKHAVSII